MTCVRLVFSAIFTIIVILLNILSFIIGYFLLKLRMKIYHDVIAIVLTEI